MINNPEQCPRTIGPATQAAIDSVIIFLIVSLEAGGIL
jgi:hypothetical protein